MKKIIRYNLTDFKNGKLANLHPLLQRIYFAREVKSAAEIDYSLQRLLPYNNLKNVESAIDLLENALINQHYILIVGDFDVDGATSTALAIKALKLFGFKNIAYLVPNRFEFGYGLTPEIVELAVKKIGKIPDLIITVDNGISSIDGVLAAKILGSKVLITDHHLPAEILPNADAIIDPNQKDDAFASKNLAGVGVIFYVMLALRKRLEKNNWFQKNNISLPNMKQFLDLVALGTIADVVALDQNNRILIAHGLEIIKSQGSSLGIKMLLGVSNREYQKVTVNDLAFAVAPRLNAAGRLEDMSLGIECLLSEDLGEARKLAFELDNLNQERREIEGDMHEKALTILQSLKFSAQNLPDAISLFDESWHQGVIGILASRIKDKLHRPTLVFALGNASEIKGSGRSIQGLHLRDVLDAIATKNPGLITKFGGHAMAAGLTLKRVDYENFNAIFVDEVSQRIEQSDLQGIIYSDGELAPEHLNLEVATLLQKGGPWGHGFPEPLFDGVFEITAQRLVGQKHLKLSLRQANFLTEIDGICFNIDTKIWPNYRCTKAHIVYKLGINEYNGRLSLQFMVEHIVPM
jgi:single-stranded-DNA-specific exonuclease